MDDQLALGDEFQSFKQRLAANVSSEVIVTLLPQHFVRFVSQMGEAGDEVFGGNPSWRDVTSFSGDGGGHSIPFKIRGPQWRVVYQLSYDGTCDFVLFCDGPNAQVIGTGQSATNQSFGLNEGDGQTNVLKTGPGQYQLIVKPGLDSAHWSITVQDWY